MCLNRAITLAGPELMFWRRSLIFLAWTERSRKDARDVLRSTQPLYLLGSSNSGVSRSNVLYRVRRKM